LRILAGAISYHESAWYRIAPLATQTLNCISHLVPRLPRLVPALASLAQESVAWGRLDPSVAG